MRFALTVILVLCLGGAEPARGQTTYTWTGLGPDGKWSTPGNWDAGGVAVSGSGTRVALNGASNTTSTFDLGSPFTLNQLSTNQAFSVGGAGTLSFAGAGAGVSRSITGPSSDLTFRVNAAELTFGDTTNSATINSGDGRTSGSAFELVLGGRLTGAGAVTLVTGSPTGIAAGSTQTVLAGTGAVTNSTYSGTLTHTSGAAFLGSANVLSRSATLNENVAPTAFGGFYLGTPGSTTAGFSAAASYSQQIGSLKSEAGNTGGLFYLGDTSATTAATALVGFNGTTDTYAGKIGASTTAAVARQAHFGKVGVGALTMTGASTGYGGGFSVRDGTVVLGGGGRVTGPTAAVTIFAGGLLQLDDSATNQQDRLPGTGTASASNAPVALTGGTLQLTGNGSANTSEIISGIRLVSGQSTVLIDGVTSARAHSLTLSGTAANGNGGISQLNTSTATVFFRSTNLGQSPVTGQSVGSNTGGVAMTVAPTLVGGGGADGSATLSILPFATGTGATSSSAVTTPESFVTYSTANSSIRSLTDAEYASPAQAVGVAASNVSIGAGTTIPGGTTYNALRLNGPAGFTVTNSGTLTLTAGALLSANTDAANPTLVSGGTLAFGGTTASTRTTAYVTTTNALNISSNLSAANLSKNGAGNLTLSGTTTLTGASGSVVAVNNGTLTLGANASVTTSNPLSGTNPLTYQVSRGATLDVSAKGLTVGNFTTLTGGYATAAAGVPNTVRGNLSVGSGGTVTPSSLGGGSADQSSPGTLAVGGNLALGGGSTYTWFVSSAITNGDNTAAPSAGTLANYLSPYTASLLMATGTIDLAGASAGNRVTLRITPLALSNAGPAIGANAVYDLNLSADTRSWVIAQAGGVNEFSADKFTIDASAFGGSGLGTYASGFSLSQVGNDIVLTYTPVPEPGAVLAVSAAALALGIRCRKRGKDGH